MLKRVPSVESATHEKTAGTDKRSVLGEVAALVVIVGILLIRSSIIAMYFLV